MNFGSPPQNASDGRCFEQGSVQQLERRKAATGLNEQYASSSNFFYSADPPDIFGQGSVFFEKKWFFLQNDSDAGPHAGVFFVRAGRVSVDKLAEVLH